MSPLEHLICAPLEPLKAPSGQHDGAFTVLTVSCLLNAQSGLGDVAADRINVSLHPSELASSLDRVRLAKRMATPPNCFRLSLTKINFDILLQSIRLSHTAADLRSHPTCRHSYSRTNRHHLLYLDTQLNNITIWQ